MLLLLYLLPVCTFTTFVFFPFSIFFPSTGFHKDGFGPLLRRLSDRSVDEEILLRQGKQLQQQQQHLGANSTSAVVAAAGAAAGGGGAATAAAATADAAADAAAPAPAPDVGLDRGSGGGNGAADGGLERVRLDAERQILLTMLLAHMCSEHDATPRTFVEQVDMLGW